MKRLAGALALLTIAAALTGCGGGSSGAQNAPTATSAASLPATVPARPAAQYSALKYIKGELRSQLRRRLARSANPSTRRYSVGSIDCSLLDQPHHWSCHIPLLSWDGSYLNQDVYYTVIARRDGSWRAKVG